MKKDNVVYYIIVASFALLVMVSCGDKKKPSRVYMPDMYYPVAYDPYNEAVKPYSDDINTVALFAEQDFATVLSPVKGTVFRDKNGILPIQLKNTPEDYAISKTITESPLKPELKNPARGKLLYEQQCAACHGVNGDGQGSIVKTGAYLGVPNYKDREITVGSVHFVITYGRNAMGSYSANLSPTDRWLVSEYVMELKNKLK